MATQFPDRLPDWDRADPKLFGQDDFHDAFAGVQLATANPFQEHFADDFSQRFSLGAHLSALGTVLPDSIEFYTVSLADCRAPG